MNVGSKSGAIVVAGIITMAAHAAAHAQEAKRLEYNIGVGILHDSNVARGSEAAAEARGLQRSDTRFSPNASATLNLPLGAHRASFTGTAGYDFYARNKRLNRERIKADANVDLRLSVCSIDLHGTFSRRQSDLGDLAITPGDLEGSSKNTETAKGAGAVVSCGGTIGLRPTAMVDWNDARNSADIRRTADNHSFTYSGGLSYVHPAVGNVTLYAGRREVDYSNRDPAITAALDHYVASRYGLIFSRDVGAQLTVGGEVLYTDVQLGDRRQGFNGINWNANATLNLSRLQIKGETRKSVEPSLGFDANYVLQRSHNLTLSYALGSRLTASLTGSISIRDYDYEPGVLDVRINHDNLKRLSAGLDFLATSRVKIGLDTAYQRRDANGVIYDYDGYQLGLRASTTF